ncbi:MAG: BlaI/MecI/CopY family transcriptional regulator [Thermoguttaceae bacterium]
MLNELAPRERQVAETVYRLEEASVQDVLSAIANPPSYSAIRAILSILVQKGVLEYRREKARYLYRPILAKQSARKSLLRNLLDTFFAGNPKEAVAALLDVAADDLSEKDYAELREIIEKSNRMKR